MASPLVLAGVRSFITAALKPEGADGDSSLVSTLLRQGIAEMFRESKAYDASWDNDTDGDLTLTGNACPLPSDCLTVERVEWDGSDTPLEIKSVAWLDEHYEGWRDEEGDPAYCAVTGRQVLLSSSPTGTTTGKLVIRGYGAPDEADALEMLPDDLLMAPAWYVLAEWPVDAANANAMFRFNRYTAKWEAKKSEIVAAVAARSMRPYEYP